MTRLKMRRAFMDHPIKPFNPQPKKYREGERIPGTPLMAAGWKWIRDENHPRTHIFHLWQQFKDGVRIPPDDYRLLWNAYMDSDTWQQRRSMVFRRARGRCEDNCEAKAEQVHHVNYANAFNETEHDLMALCGDCHQDLHATPRGIEKWRMEMLK